MTATIANSTKLQRGSRVVNLYGKEGIVTRYIPGSEPIIDLGGSGVMLAGGGFVDIIYLDATRSHKTPEAIALRPPWKILDGLAAEEEIQALQTAHTEKLEKALQAKQRAEDQHRRAIAEGKPIIEKSMPKWAKAVIVGRFEEDKSEPMSDYHGIEPGPKHVLAWSKHTYDMFPEMRKAAALMHETCHLSVVPKVNANGQPRTEQNKSYWHPADEHREKYSMGAGYYLKAGSRHSTGWRVYKVRLDHKRMEWLYLAAGSGRYLVKSKN